MKPKIISQASTIEPSNFLNNNLLRFFKHYEIYVKTSQSNVFTSSKYMVYHKKHNGLFDKPLSTNITISLCPTNGHLLYESFHPNLSSFQTESKYLSASLFMLTIDHFLQSTKNLNSKNIYLQSTFETYIDFYIKLKDIKFTLKNPDELVDFLSSPYIDGISIKNLNIIVKFFNNNKEAIYRIKSKQHLIDFTALFSHYLDKKIHKAEKHAIITEHYKTLQNTPLSVAATYTPLHLEKYFHYIKTSP
jgi:hypothetical protein